MKLHWPSGASILRQPKPFFRQQTQSWYVQIDKKQHNLGPDKEKAKQKYHELMAGRQPAETTTTVASIIGRFLAWSQLNSQPSTHGFYSRPLLSFCEAIGVNLKVRDLKPFHVTRWLDARYKGKSSNYRRNAIRAVQRAFNWAVDEGYLEKSPVKGIKKPRATPRDVLISPEQWNELEEALRVRGEPGAAFLDLLTIMRQTGCRPKEARTAEARHLDLKNRCLVFERIKRLPDGSEREESKGGLERRVVPLTDTAFEICSRYASNYPSGVLFRNSAGQPWDRGQIKHWFKRLDGTSGRPAKQTAKLPRLGFRLQAYAIRHTWATEALQRGVDPITVATIMGHNDVTQLMKTYQHLNKKSDHIRAMLHIAVGTSPTAMPGSEAQPA
jgi:integrase